VGAEAVASADVGRGIGFGQDMVYVRFYVVKDFLFVFGQLLGLVEHAGELFARLSVADSALGDVHFVLEILDPLSDGVGARF
jgi:hypothetical protein